MAIMPLTYFVINLVLVVGTSAAGGVVTIVAIIGLVLCCRLRCKGPNTSVITELVVIYFIDINAQDLDKKMAPSCPSTDRPQ